MIKTYKPTKLAMFDNRTLNLSGEQVIKKMGCDLLFNGGVYNADRSLCCDVRIEGKWLANDVYTYYGYAWTGDDMPKIVHTNEANKYDNFVSCYDVQPNIKRGRTAFGMTADDQIVILCVHDGSEAMTIPEVHAALDAQECVSYLALDGGTSAEFITKSGGTIVDSKRSSAYYIGVWIESKAANASNAILEGIDVSEWQGVIDWEKVKPQIDYAIIRAGLGKGRIDKQFVRNISECNRLGIPCGVYWFSYALNAQMAQNEAAYCLAAIKPYKLSYPICFDFEYDSVAYAKNRGITITKALASSFVTAFCNAIEAAGHYAVNYTNSDYLSRYYSSDIAARYDLWLASYPAVPDINKPPKTCGMWQYGVKPYVGINGDVDSNAAYKNYPKIISNMGALK